MARTVLPAFTQVEGISYINSQSYRLNSMAAAYRIYDLMNISHAVASARGWWTDKASGQLESRSIGELYALMHSELSEGLEGVRSEIPSTKIPSFTNEEEELADLLHRVFDYAKARNLNLGDAFVAKASYNINREDHSAEARSAAGGKEF